MTLFAIAGPFTIQAVATDSDLVSRLHTGGGFVFLGVIMSGLFLWSKNTAEGAKTLAEGSSSLLREARIDLADARTVLDATEAKLRTTLIDLATARDELRSNNMEREFERRRFRRWVVDQKAANDAHKVWDEELRAQVELLGGHIRPAPPFGVCPPEDLDQPPR